MAVAEARSVAVADNALLSHTVNCNNLQQLRKHGAQVHHAGAAWLPYTLLDQLLAALRTAVDDGGAASNGTHAALRTHLQQLDATLKQYLATAERQSHALQAAKN